MLEKDEMSIEELFINQFKKDKCPLCSENRIEIMNFKFLDENKFLILLLPNNIAKDGTCFRLNTKITNFDPDSFNPIFSDFYFKCISAVSHIPDNYATPSKSGHYFTWQRIRLAKNFRF